MTLGTGTGLTGTLIPSSIVSSLCSVYITDLSVKHVPYDSLSQYRPLENLDSKFG